MKLTKALITAAGPDQRKLPLQTLIDKKQEKFAISHFKHIRLNFLQ